MNNETRAVVEGKINTLARTVLENGGLGSATKRVIEDIAKTVISENLFFNKVSNRLRGTGARVNKRMYTTRAGWTTRDRAGNAWMEWGFNQTISVLSENLIVNQTVETSMEWDLTEYKDGEIGFEKLVSFLKNALMEELPVEYEKRFLNTIKNLMLNGVELQSDDVVGNGIDYPTALPQYITVNYDTIENTKATLKEIIRVTNRMGKIENPVIYRPNKTKWKFYMNTDFATAINEAGGFQQFYDSTAWERALNNTQQLLLNGIEVEIHNNLEDDQPFLFLPKMGSFPNIDLFFTNIPENFYVREDYMGQSASKKFLKIESSEFAINVSYWAVKLGLVLMGRTGTNAMSSPKLANIHISEYGDEGAFTYKYTLDGSNLAVGTAFDIVLVNNRTFEESVLTTLTTTAEVSTIETTGEETGTATGSYMLQIRDSSGYNITTSPTFYIRNLASDVGTIREDLSESTTKSAKTVAKPSAQKTTSKKK